MPQVKGNANWMINPRRLTSDPPVRSIGIDNSGTHIENEAAEESMRKELDDIHLQSHRALADRMFDLKQTKKDISNYNRMKTLTSHKQVDNLLEKRRAETQALYGDNEPGQNGLTSNKAATASSSSLSKRPQTGPALRKQKNGFSHIEIDDSDDDDYYYNKHYRNAATSSTTVLVPTTTAHPSRSRRRPRTSHPARSRRQIRQALEEEFTNLGKGIRRPKTTLGFVRGEGDAAYESSNNGQTPGRSFQELRDLTHIDHLNGAQLRERERYIKELRNERLVQEQKLLQNKLDKFYDNIDKFKEEASKRVLKTTVLY